jgi:hypothetical protein
MASEFALAMAGAAAAHQAAAASREGNGQQRVGSRRRSSADPQRAQQGATAAADAAPAALDRLSRLQHLADASPQVAQLRLLQALADGRSAPVAQLAGGPEEEEELLQGKFASDQIQPQLQQAPRANNTGLPDQLKRGIESLSGLSMDHVRVHYNSAHPAQLNALAYAQGSDIHLAPGQEQHLPHEAWHVVQQAQGRVRPTMQMKEGAVPVNDDAGLEAEADVMGAKALAFSSPPARQPSRAAPPLHFLTVQRKDARTKAKERKIVLTQPALGSKDEALVAPRGASLADDPEFEKRALDFERRLGHACFNDSRANDAAARLCKPILGYIKAKLARIEGDEARVAAQRRMYTDLAGQSAYAGAVTESDKTASDEADLRKLSEPINAVIEGGNLRERLNLVDQFIRILGNDFAAASGENYAGFRAIVEEAKLNVKALDKRHASLGDKKPKERQLLEHAPKDSSLVKRDAIRVMTSDPQPFTDMSARELRTAPLSERESEHQDVSKPTDKLAFTEGSKQFAINEANAWVEAMRTLSLPLKAGPSGHTQVFMEANQLLGAAASPFAIRLACIGHLLPINAHSLVEILDVAHHHGCPYQAGPLMYRQILPMSTQELRVIGGGRFPDESTDEERRRNVRAEQRSNIPELNDLELAKHLKGQESRMAHSLEDMGVKKGGSGPVSEVLKAKDGEAAQTRAAIEHALRNPIKSDVQRQALKTADTSAQSTEEVDVGLAKAKIQEALKALGAKKDYPRAYERCIQHLQNSPLTTNLFTPSLFSVLRGGYLNRAERTQGTADTNKIFNADYGNPDYAYKRDQAEQKLHVLPPMHPHFVPEDMQEARDEVLHARMTGGTSKIATDVYKKDMPLIMVTSEKGVQSFPLEEPQRPETEVFRGKEHLKPQAEPRMPVSLPSDRPHSAALNPLGYRSGGAPSVAYGKSSLVFKHEVNERSTYTGMDSKDYMFEGKAATRGGPQKGVNDRAVASYEHIARALIHCDVSTLRAIVYQALELQRDGIKAPAMQAIGGAGLSYIEAQIFGQIDLSRDVAKIIIDEDDLDLWEEGLLKTDTLKTVAAKPKNETKRELIAWASSLGVPIQFIRSGRNTADPSGAGPHLADVAEPWEGMVERALTDMAARRWQAASNAVVEITHGTEPEVKGRLWRTYSGVGLGALKAQRDRAEQAFNDREKRGKSVDRMKLLDGVAELAHEALTEYLTVASAVDHAYRPDAQRLSLQIAYWLGKCIVGNLLLKPDEALAQEELGSRESASRRGRRPDGKSVVVVEPSLSKPSNATLKTGSTKTSALSKPKPRDKQLNWRLTSPVGNRNLDVFDTGGGGDCGIHAVLGQFDGGTGQMLHAEPNSVRVMLANAILRGQIPADKYYDLIADLLRQIYLKVIAGEGLTRDENTAWREFGTIEGIEQRLQSLLELENQRYTYLGVQRGQIVDNYLEVIAGPSATFEPLRQFLVMEVLRSRAQSDASVRERLESVSEPSRTALLRQLPYVYLRSLVESNLDGLARAGGDVDALRELIGRQRNYGLNVNETATTFRPLVVEHAAQFLAAYSRCVAVPGYYLRDQDVMLLAQLYGKEAVLYRQHDVDPKRYQVISGNPEALNAVHVFHSGVHYEHAEHRAD